MATRCGVRVRVTRGDKTEEAGAYHHWDGYPSNMMKLFREALQAYSGRCDNFIDTRHCRSLSAERALQVVMSAEPEGFGVGYRGGDLEYAYLIDASEADPDKWTITGRSGYGTWEEIMNGNEGAGSFESWRDITQEKVAA